MLTLSLVLFSRCHPFKCLNISYLGLKIVFNLANPVGQRLISVHARCLECDIPSYSPLIDSDHYLLYVSSFLISGGDGYSFEPLEHQKISKCRLVVMYICHVIYNVPENLSQSLSLGLSPPLPPVADLPGARRACVAPAGLQVMFLRQIFIAAESTIKRPRFQTIALECNI